MTDTDITASQVTEDVLETADVTEVKQEVTETQKPLSFDDVLKNPKFQSEFDKKIHKALETSRATWEAEAKMTAEERATHILSQREQEIVQREAAQDKREFTADIREALVEQGLPPTFTEVLADGCTRDNFSEVLYGIKSEWDRQITEQIKSGARQKSPQVGTSIAEANAGKNVDLAKYAQEIRKVK